MRGLKIRMVLFEPQYYDIFIGGFMSYYRRFYDITKVWDHLRNQFCNYFDQLYYL